MGVKSLNSYVTYVFHSFPVAICWSGPTDHSLLQEVYKLPVIKAMVDASPADAITLQPSDDIHEDPFVLLNAFGLLGMPDRQ